MDENVSEKNGVAVRVRAEEYRSDELCRLKTVNGRLYFQIQDYVKNKRRYPMFLLGGKGFGKTFNVLKAVLERKWGKKTPSIFIFKRREKLELMKPVEGRIVQEFDMDEVIRSSSVVVFDDVHYVCDAVIDGELPIEFLIGLLETVVCVTRKSKKVILISDEMLSYYADIFDDERLDALLLEFGEMRFEEMKGLSWGAVEEYRERMKHLVKLQLPPIDFTDFCCLFDVYGVEADEFVKRFLFFSANGNPRGFSSFISMFGPGQISKGEVVEKAKERLSRRVDGGMLVRLFDVPELPVDFDYFNAMNKQEMFSKAIKKFKTFRELAGYVERMTEMGNRIDAEIGKVCECFLNKLSRERRLLEKKCGGVDSMRYLKGSRVVKTERKLLVYWSLVDFFKGQGMMSGTLHGERIGFIVAEAKKWNNSFYYYVGLYRVLKGMKMEELKGWSDEEFDVFWRDIPMNYAGRWLYRPLRLAFQEAFAEGWYLVKGG